MSTVKATAHLNELTKEVTSDYYLRPNLLGTLREDDIIRRLKKKEIATENVNGKAFLQVFQRECAEAVSEGYNVITGLFHATIGISGAVHTQDLGRHLPAGKVNARMTFTQGEYAREALKNMTISVAEQPAPTGPVIQAVTNPVAGLPDTLNTGAMALLQGMRIAVRGEKDREGEIGVYFTSIDGTVEVHIPAGQLSPNTPKKLQFVLPAGVTPGEWRVKVATQSLSKALSFTKDVREYEYPNMITVV
ncbi:MAG: DUF4469 domain-containing protein [Bacteroidales bacterium]|jgi:hypothetical protein|nr:DUF4469 domain-containing protein [Bacteroidales bacterium]